MEKKNKIAVLGGDRRQISLARYLKRNGADVYTYGLMVKPDSTLQVCDDLACAVKGAAAVILPLPALDASLVLKTDGEKKITLSDICDCASPDTLFLGGMWKPAAKEELARRALAWVDYYEGEELQKINAIPTAEGALAVAISERERTIAGSRSLVIGYGRIGKVLARYLAVLGSKVTVAARRKPHFEMIRMSGYTPALTGNLNAELAEADLIFNTVPVPLLGKTELARVKEKAVLIELASAPYGIDFDAAEALGKKAVLAASLPGRMFPETAGETLGLMILDLLQKRGVL